jgi:hypothetical protein
MCEFLVFKTKRNESKAGLVGIRKEALSTDQILARKSIRSSVKNEVQQYYW